MHTILRFLLMFSFVLFTLSKEKGMPPHRIRFEIEQIFLYTTAVGINKKKEWNSCSKTGAIKEINRHSSQHVNTWPSPRSTFFFQHRVCRNSFDIYDCLSVSLEIWMPRSLSAHAVWKLFVRDSTPLSHRMRLILETICIQQTGRPISGQSISSMRKAIEKENKTAK